MQNKFLYQILCAGLLTLTVQPALAQEDNDFLAPAEETLGELTPEVTVKPTAAPVMAEATTDVTPDLTGKQAVDFPGRTSLDTLELAPLPGIYETNITGPAPMAPSVSAKDMPSERLLGRLTPEVFQEMAELERDNTFLKLQIQKETMKNDLERLRANYRQARLDEIAKREDVVRTRIQWWQEQEKIRQDLEAQRAAAENLKAANEENAEQKALDAMQDNDGVPAEVEKIVQKAPEPVKASYTLVGIVGVHDSLTATVKSIENNRLFTAQEGDTLPDGSQVISITANQVVLSKKDTEIALTFEDM